MDPGVKDSPFFIYLAHTMPHQPISTSERFLKTSARGLYGDVLRTIDAGVGRILETLQEAGIDENTLVIFTSDNGPWLTLNQYGGSAGLLREGKGWTYEGGIRVPFIARWPRRVPAGLVNSGIASTMDIYTTCLRLSGAEIPSDRIVDGEDILPLLTGEEPSPHKAFFYYSGHLLEAVRDGKWKLRIGRSSASDGSIAEELFDLEVDPSEKFNLAAAFPRRVEALKSLLEKEKSEMIPGPAYADNLRNLQMLRELYRTRGGIKIKPPEPAATVRRIIAGRALSGRTLGGPPALFHRSDRRAEAAPAHSGLAVGDSRHKFPVTPLQNTHSRVLAHRIPEAS